MNLEWLEVFREVAVRGSLTAAAETLGYTQPTLSRQLTALEKEMGARLFDRLPRGVRLTDAGQSLLAHAEAVLDRVELARQSLDALRTLDAGRLRIGAFESADATLVPQALADFRTTHPQVELSLVEANTSALVDRLRAGEVDLAVLSAYPQQGLDTSRLELHYLMKDALLVALPDGHRLAHRRTLRLAELAEESWVEGFPDSAATLHETASRAGFRPRIDFAVREWTAKLGFVAAGLGIALVPRLAATATRPGITLVPLRATDTPVRTVYAATSRGVTDTPAVTAFRSCLDQVAKTLRP
ncbi:LysR substrate-binding domain-containing protein [Kribbella sp. NPDC026611]|uniref:LysR family transcriptional regulator n=1 Tax=Kribbella sp. NPDC026611 TaxID=3154911 RepID=UPI0033E2D682